MIIFNIVNIFFLSWNDKSEKQKLTHVKFVFYRSVVELYLHNGSNIYLINDKLYS